MQLRSHSKMLNAVKKEEIVILEEKPSEILRIKLEREQRKSNRRIAKIEEQKVKAIKAEIEEIAPGLSQIVHLNEIKEKKNKVEMDGFEVIENFPYMDELREHLKKFFIYDDTFHVEENQDSQGYEQIKRKHFTVKSDLRCFECDRDKQILQR